MATSSNLFGKTEKHSSRNYTCTKSKWHMAVRVPLKHYNFSFIRTWFFYRCSNCKKRKINPLKRSFRVRNNFILIQLMWKTWRISKENSEKCENLNEKCFNVTPSWLFVNSILNFNLCENYAKELRWKWCIYQLKLVFVNFTYLVQNSKV